MPKGVAARVHVGDRVGVRFGAGMRPATVIEDRGRLGVGGERVYRLSLDDNDEGEERVSFELPESSLERFSDAVHA